MLVDDFVEDDGTVVLHRLLALDEGSHGRERAHQPLDVRGRVVGGGLDGCPLAFDVQNLEGHASAMICGDAGPSQRLLCRGAGTPPPPLPKPRTRRHSPPRQREWGNWMEVRAGVESQRTSKRGPPTIHGFSTRLAYLLQDKREYVILTAPVTSKIKPVRLHW